MNYVVGRIFLLLELLACTLSAPVLAADALLAPDVAFRFSAKVLDEKAIQVHYQIADGYYLYRDRLQFAVSQGAVKLGSPNLPAGIVKDDPFFGRVAIYRGAVLIDLPLKSPVSTTGFTLKVISQGCADIGVCYMPLTQTARLESATAASNFDNGLPSPRKSAGLLARLQSGVGPAADEPEFLPVEKAFSVEVRFADAQTLVARLAPADGYYLYRDKIRFTTVPGTETFIDSVQIPRGETKRDPNFGETEVFHLPVQVVIRLGKAIREQDTLLVNVAFQGCSEKGLCYPPASRQLPVTFAASASPDPGGLSTNGASSLQYSSVLTVESAEDTKIARFIKTGNVWLIMVSFLGFGLLLSFTPCVLPMVPILSGIIAGQGKKITRMRGILLSSMYVLGMAISYAIAGVLAGLSGTLLSTALQTPWALISFAGVFVLLALSMFGLYELQLPVAWQTGAADTSNRLTAGTVAGVFGMGAVSAVIVGPCVAAPLAGALLYVSQSHDVVLGGLALFMMGIGMGLPLLIIGASAGAFLPRAGAWMQTVKRFLGVLLLAGAIWMVAPLISVTVQMLCWSVLFILSGIYLHAIDPLPAGASSSRKLWKGIGVIALLLGIAFLVGGLSGGRDILQPLSGLQARTGGQGTEEPAFIPVGSIADLERAVARPGKSVMLDFYADWCVACKEMERLTFQDANVKKRLDNMLLLRADVTDSTADSEALLKRFGLYGPPGVIFFDRHGKELKELRVIGYQPPARFLSVLANLENLN
jgi:thiol:disulfide interchange protein DsbD